MTQLLPCPFCGSTDIDTEFWAGGDYESGNAVSGPGCMDCGATAETAEKWNCRTPLSPPQQSQQEV